MQPSIRVSVFIMGIGIYPLIANAQLVIHPQLDPTRNNSQVEEVDSTVGKPVLHERV